MAKSIHVVVIEDEADLLNVCVEVLNGKGYQARGFLSAEDFLAAEASTDLIIADITLPGRSGLELLEIVKEKNPDVKVVLISGYGDEELLKGKAASFLPKPFSARDLLALVEKTAGNSI